MDGTRSVHLMISEACIRSEILEAIEGAVQITHERLREGIRVARRLLKLSDRILDNLTR